MQMWMMVRRLSVFAVCVCLAGACRGNGDGARGAVEMDTTNTEWEDGLSAQQVEGEARAMSPEEAARAGLAVDTSIHLEQLDARDSLPALGVPPVQDPTLGGSGTLDGPDADPFPPPPSAPVPPATGTRP